MLGFDIKKLIEEAVLKTVREYKREKGLSELFLDPIIGYARANDPLFRIFVERNWTLHPKEIYLPGNTVVIHFLPFAPAVVESNRGVNGISNEWVAAYEAAILFSAHINGCVKETLESYGRLVSLTNLPGDWNEERDHSDWSHKLAAFVAGMGDFGIAASFNTPVGSAGRFGSVITEYVIEPSKYWPERDAELLNSIADEIERSYLFTTSDDVKVSHDKIRLCPAGAITPSGVDRLNCRDFCAAQQQIVPNPDVCGKCFDS